MDLETILLISFGSISSIICIFSSCCIYKKIREEHQYDNLLNRILIENDYE
jgi:hypothetical protein